MGRNMIYDPAKTAYEAYVASMKAQPLPAAMAAWDELPPQQVAIWTHVARAVIDETAEVMRGLAPSDPPTMRWDGRNVPA